MLCFLSLLTKFPWHAEDWLMLPGSVKKKKKNHHPEVQAALSPVFFFLSSLLPNTHTSLFLPLSHYLWSVLTFTADAEQQWLDSSAASLLEPQDAHLITRVPFAISSFVSIATVNKVRIHFSGYRGGGQGPLVSKPATRVFSCYVWGLKALKADQERIFSLWYVMASM